VIDVSSLRFGGGLALKVSSNPANIPTVTKKHRVPQQTVEVASVFWYHFRTVCGHFRL
jgi:hypothetical protein